MSETLDWKARSNALRQEFDAAFASPPSRQADELEHVVALRVAEAHYALRLRDISVVVAQPQIMPIPARAPGLLGLMGLRGDVVPVFGLAALIGSREEHEPASWLIVCGAQTEPVGLAFSEFHGYLRVPKSAFHTDHSLAAATGHVSEVIVTEHGSRPVIALPRVIATLRQRGRGSSIKEQ